MSITNEQFTQRVLARASNAFHSELVVPVICNNAYSTSIIALHGFIDHAEVLDAFKKALFYGKPVTGIPTDAKFADEWKPLLAQLPTGEQMFHSMLGIATEAGELAAQVTDAMSGEPGAEFDRTNYIEEMGDLLWYIALGLDAVGCSISECMTINDAKLEKRFGEAFSEDAALNRDLDAERIALEQSREDKDDD